MEDENISTSDIVDNVKSVENVSTVPTIHNVGFDQEKFKKPILLIGPRCGKPGKIRLMNHSSQKKEKQVPENNLKQLENLEIKLPDDQMRSEIIPVTLESSKTIPLPYKEPHWGGTPSEKYKIEVLKSGVILEIIDLSDRSCHVVGRLLACDIPMAHPTISRYHAVFQYRSIPDSDNPKGLYVYDLGSTHGTFWNGNRIRPNMYVRLRGGHMVRFGASQRKYIVQAPDEDQEEESELSITELKEQRRLELEERDRIDRERKLLIEEEERIKKEREENEGINWGMGEDAEEESDLKENPFASVGDEELSLDDPKKTLRGWFEREGYDLQYQTEEKGIGQFLCWVELPIENVVGHSARAEALVKGKKKESVIQCALEACKILDRYGLLRQANHEARKRKSINWEEQDFYDSDEDNYLDRTGSVEKKRAQRMKLAGKSETKTENYNSLLEKYQQVVTKINQIQNKFKKSENIKNKKLDDEDEDALDAFMSTLDSCSLSKDSVIQMKIELQHLQKEETNLLKLVNLTRPADLPPLNPQKTDSLKKENKYDSSKKPIFGQRKMFKSLKNKSEFKETMDTYDGSSKLCTDEPESESEEFENENQKETQIKSESVTEENIVEIANDRLKKETTFSDSQGDDNHCENDVHSVVDTKRKKRVRKREKSEIQKQVYESEGFREDYSTWVPPSNQSGDGRTTLNDKYGY